MTPLLTSLLTGTLLLRRTSKRFTSARFASGVPPDLFAASAGLDPALNRFHGPIVYHEDYSFDDWPPNHTFPMDKFGRLAHAVLTTTSKTHPQSSNLPRPLVRDAFDFFRPLDDVPRAWFAEPTGPINADFLDRFLRSELTHEEKRHVGFREQTDRPELIRRTLLEVAGTVLAAQLASTYGIASNLAGGTHHAHRDMGAGYTILNDLAVTANFLTNESLNKGSVQGIEKVLVGKSSVTCVCLETINEWPSASMPLCFSVRSFRFDASLPFKLSFSRLFLSRCRRTPR